MSETRRFSIHPHIIHDLIVAQAGTLAKAVLECIMNSIDAGATRLDIDIDSRRIRIDDDGSGFQSRQEIQTWFEVFGFPHEEGGRTYGKFGIGRGQLWSFCSTVWRTNAFEMDVDVKRDGLDYRLREGLDMVKGVMIDGTFYTPLLTSELMAFEKELTELACFAQVPVRLNGHPITKDPGAEKWDFDTPDAWVQVSEGSSLAVYNLGVLVRHYSAYQFGCGGVVLTKPGVRLKLNMARNDVLIAQCEVWKRIGGVLQSKSDERVRTKRVRHSPAELENFAKRFIGAELEYEQVKDLKLITDIVGRGHTISGMAEWIWRNEPGVVTQAPTGSRKGERAHRGKLAFVLAQSTLERFGVNSVEALCRSLWQAVEREDSGHWLARRLHQASAYEQLDAAAPTLQDGYDVLAEKDLSKADLAGLRTLTEMALHVGQSLIDKGYVSSRTAKRRIYLGRSDCAEAWTDGESQIVVERRNLQLMKLGIGGFVGLTHILVHEFLHDSSDAGSHTHDHEFYARYHDATCGRAGVLNQAAARGLAKWILALRSYRLKVPRLAAQHLDEGERLHRQSLESAE